MNEYFFPDTHIDLATKVLEKLRSYNYKIATAESCTAGLIIGCLTEIPGSSDVIDRGFATYSNEAKAETLGIDPELINTHGAVSEEVAEAMAKGAINNSNADISIAVTGIAGPGGGTNDKPVGLVHFGIHNKKTNNTICFDYIFDGNRASVRLQTVEQALLSLLEEGIS